LSGGGLCGLAYIGALRFLQIEGFDKTIHHVAGSSIGALFATIFAARISLTDVERKLRTMLCDDGHLMEFAYPDMLSVLANLGVDDGHTFLAFLRPELDKLTFVDLVKRTGVHLVICATHVETMRTTYFSVDTTPNVLVYDALRASMARG
jgi:predicted acylesterase/phospholipase RssA